MPYRVLLFIALIGPVADADSLPFDVVYRVGTLRGDWIRATMLVDAEDLAETDRLTARLFPVGRPPRAADPTFREILLDEPFADFFDLIHEENTLWWVDPAELPAPFQIPEVAGGLPEKIAVRFDSSFELTIENFLVKNFRVGIEATVLFRFGGRVEESRIRGFVDPRILTTFAGRPRNAAPDDRQRYAVNIGGELYPVMQYAAPYADEVVVLSPWERIVLGASFDENHWFRLHWQNLREVDRETHLHLVNLELKRKQSSQPTLVDLLAGSPWQGERTPVGEENAALHQSIRRFYQSAQELDRVLGVYRSCSYSIAASAPRLEN